MKSCIIVFLGSLLLATLVRAETATLTMRFVFDGQAPAARQRAMPGGIAAGGGKILDESLLVDPTTNGIKNVVVHVYTGRGGSTLESVPYEGKTRRIEVRNSRFDPHILIARTGDKLELVNRDPLRYAPNIHFFNNQPRSWVVPAGKVESVLLAQPEPAPIPVDCNLHPWMRAYVVVLDHPFVAVSGEDGSITIKGLPANRRLAFRVYHESGPIRRVTIAEEVVSWRGTRFELDLHPGVNELGDVLVPANALAPF